MSQDIPLQDAMEKIHGWIFGQLKIHSLSLMLYNVHIIGFIFLEEVVSHSKRDMEGNFETPICNRR